ncbi:hypothetical protein H5410_016217 [Solanum commersonii]|uniref:Uncharacterized protein n=1 Tax=Solanum commersonii TaxID=4109 RepID=A0A9J5ZVV3_SOLCO|nr:hypothetical protein H5410_016217 [Solanum commersonii]
MTHCGRGHRRKPTEDEDHEKKAPAQPILEMINHVLTYLNGLSDQGQAHNIFYASTNTSGSWSTTRKLLWLPTWMHP